MAVWRLLPLAVFVTTVGLASPAIAVTDVTFSGGMYGITGDGADDVVTLSCLNGSVSPSSVPDAPCAGVTRIEVAPGDGSDEVDLSAVTRADFPQVFRLVISGEGPQGESDVLRGSQLD